MPLVAVVGSLPHQRVLLTGNLLLAHGLSVVKHEVHPSSLFTKQGSHTRLLSISQQINGVQGSQCINPLGQCLVQRLGRIAHTQTTGNGIRIAGQVLTRDPGHHELGQLA